MYLTNAIQCFVLLATSERRLSPRTVVLYAKALEKLEAYAKANGRARVVDLTPNLLRAAAAAEMNEQQRRPRALNWRGGEAMGSAMVSATRTMLRRLNEEFPELVLPDLSMVKTPKVPDRIQPRLEEGEYVRLESTLRLRLLRDRVPRFLIARDMAILAVLGNTGLRAAECCGLDVEDADLNEGVLKVRKGKGNKWRILNVCDPDPSVRGGGEVIEALADYLRWRERIFGPYLVRGLWLTLKGNRLDPNGLRRMLSALCDEAGLDSSRPPHAFRRGYFTEQYQDQPNALPVLIERMGWESDAMVKVYTRGVQVELARRIPLPLLSKKWRASQKVLVTNRSPQPIITNGVGPPRGETANDAAPSNPGRRNGNRAASQTPSRRPAPQP